MTQAKAKHEDRTDWGLTAPWAATGRLPEIEKRAFYAAMACDPVLARDFAAARAEKEAVVAMTEACPRPSVRPLLALFEAIDAKPGGSIPARVRDVSATNRVVRFERSPRVARPIGGR
jgi:hypothetical protein